MTRNAVFGLINSKNCTIIKRPFVSWQGGSGEDNIVFAQTSESKKYFVCRKPGLTAKDFNEERLMVEQLYSIAVEPERDNESVLEEDLLAFDD